MHAILKYAVCAHVVTRRHFVQRNAAEFVIMQLPIHVRNSAGQRTIRATLYTNYCSNISTNHIPKTAARKRK